MYAVIFRVEIKILDQSYSDMAARMRDLAKSKYGCIDLTTLTEGNQEVTISYWANEEKITAWKNDPEHQKAQELGCSKWYKSYNVEVVKVEREYSNNT